MHAARGKHRSVGDPVLRDISKKQTTSKCESATCICVDMARLAPVRLCQVRPRKISWWAVQFWAFVVQENTISITFTILANQ